LTYFNSVFYIPVVYPAA